MAKVKVLTSFVDRHTLDIYQVGEVIEFDVKRIKEIQSVDASLIEVLKEEKKGDEK